MSRIVGACISILLAWCGLVAPAASAVTPASSTTVHYSYDGMRHAEPVHNAASERGLPAATRGSSTYYAGGRRAHGDSALPTGSTNDAPYDYLGIVPFAQVDTNAATTSGPALAYSGDLPAFHRSRVAAKTADDIPLLLKPGPFANGSIPARSSSQSFRVGERKAINDFGYSDGCHSCGIKIPGTKSGNFVPDHQPVSGLNNPPLAQQLYPQCISCSREQGVLIARLLRGAGQ